MALLELKDVFMVNNGKVRALDGINFSIEKSKWIAIVSSAGNESKFRKKICRRES